MTFDRRPRQEPGHKRHIHSFDLLVFDSAQERQRQQVALQNLENSGWNRKERLTTNRAKS
jgi:hypothetical protein